MCFNCTGSLFPSNHILDDNEFRYSLHYFHNSIEYNRLLSLKLNPFVFDDLINDNTANDVVNSPSDTSCNYVFDCSLDDIDVSFKNGFSILHLNSRSFNRNRDNIEVFLSNIKYNFSIIAMSETWFKQDNSNSNYIDIPNYSLINVPLLNRKSGGSALYTHDSISCKIRIDLILTAQNTNRPPTAKLR